MYPVVKGSTSQCSLHFSSLRCGLEKKKKRKWKKKKEKRYEAVRSVY